MAKPAVELVVGLNDTVSDFSKSNGLDREADYHGRSDQGIFAFQARASVSSDPDGYIVTYKSGGCGATLPAGRYVQIGYVGPKIDGITSVLPMEPLEFEDARAMAEDIYRRLEQGGWETKRYRPEVSPQSIAETIGTTPRHTYALMVGCGDDEARVSIVIKYYNALPPGPSAPPVPGTPLPDDYPDRYILTVGWLTYPSDFYDLLEARREAITGDRNKDIGIDIWLDDPDWRPEK
ncbi:hypothetical protein [Roseovarius sp. M141]|uniref:hypothetical protein n=1 Tax=Roseovarius sp. M141 TaxID=2583806 RepID=UPI0020CBCE74|nr:hypothetical protein [Roseovarius sp. M141]MCQ0093433.1 hypothetical protein [Roseovarius sp. M141]